MYLGRVVYRPWRDRPFAVQAKEHWWSRWKDSQEYADEKAATRHARGLCSERVVWPPQRGSDPRAFR